jgi:hypothetical protein
VVFGGKIKTGCAKLTNSGFSSPFTVWVRARVQKCLELVTPSMKEYRKRNESGAEYDDPRIAVGPGVLTEL